jgi:hypothetical protein
MARLLLGLALALLLGACSGGASTEAAEKGVVSFHRDLDAGKYVEIYDASASDMKSTISREDFAKLLDAFHRKLGPFKSGKTVSWNVNFATGGNYVTLQREAQFGRGPGTEEFVFRVVNDHAILAGYHVNSNLLIMN